MQPLTIITRMSPLAMWQAEFVRAQLNIHHPELEIKIKGIKTLGDRWLATPLYSMGGKSLFVKELEQALIAGEADIAVHSLKDVPAVFPEGLGLAAVLARENPFDAWVSPNGIEFKRLPPGSKVGTSSLRRQLQLAKLRPDLEYSPLRGNIDTRLRKCQAGEWDAIVLAAAGLQRLKLQAAITHLFTPDELLPAVGQGALGVECRLKDDHTRELIAPLADLSTTLCVTAERSMNAKLGGSCQVAIAGFAQLSNTELTDKVGCPAIDNTELTDKVGCPAIDTAIDKLTLTAKVGCPRTGTILFAKQSGSSQTPAALGEEVAELLLAQGAAQILQGEDR